MSEPMRAILIILLGIYACLAHAYKPSDLVGTWKSNEKMTLASMEATPDIPEKNRAFFRNHFFGRLVVVSKPESSAVYFADEKPEKLAFRNHKITQLSETEFRVTYPDEPTSEDSAGVITLHGNCYSVEVSKWKFREYFCLTAKNS